MGRVGTLWGALAAIGLVTALAPAAVAGPPSTAAELAADCNDDGQVTITGSQHYRGGSGSLTGGCSLVLAPGATLVLDRVELRGDSYLVAISSPRDTTIRVVDSDIEVAGALELTAGCCAGDPLVPEQDGTVTVHRSRLQGDSVQLMASFDWPYGRIQVHRSELVATGSLGIQVRASDLGGTNGRVRVTRSTLSSAGDVLVRTGTRGRTTASRSTFTASGSVTVATGVDGTCRTSRTVPDVACS
jgi:hypothetical protein